MGSGHFRQRRSPGRLTPRRRAVCALLALPALALSGEAAAQSASEAAPASAAILESGTMTKLADMDFGRLSQPTVASWVNMSPNFPTCTLGPQIVHLGACHPARFTVMGRKNWLVRIREMNGGTIALTGPGGATMTVSMLSLGTTDMTPAPGGGNPPGSFGRQQITSDSGVAEFRIGGRLNIGANQAVGEYTGTMTIQVLFN